MQFILIARDDTGQEALNRRMAARADHIKYSDFAVESGEQILGAALLDKEDNMCGTVMVVEFENVEKLQEWLKHEPYMTGNVWKDIDIVPCKLGPSFNHCIKKKA